MVLDNRKFSWPVFWDFFIPIFILAVITIVFRITNLDLIIARSFYDPSLSLGFNTDAYPWCIFYKVGGAPAIVAVTAAGFLFVLGFLKKSLKKYRIRSLFVILLMVIAPGIIINAILKDNMGRPRPAQCTEFHGTYQFEKVWTPVLKNNDCKSFPSGHASVGFFLFFPFFLYRAFRKNKKAIMWLLIGLAYGGIMTYTRMFQGGHFMSDCLWAGGIDYLVALVLYYALRLRKDAVGLTTKYTRVT